MKRLLSTETLATLCLLLAIVVASAGFGAHAQVVPDSRNVTKAGSPCLVYGQMDAAKASGGADWNLRAYTDPVAFPSNTTLIWQVPDRAQVWGYPQIECGHMTGANPAVASVIRPLVKVNEIVVTADVVLTLSPKGEANVLSDTFIYKTTTRPTDYATEVAARYGELGVFLSIAPSQRAWAMAQPCIGSCFMTDRKGRVWNARVANAVYLMFFPVDGSYLAGTFDLKEYLDFATGRGFAWASSGVLFGSALGVEPIRDGGAATFKTATIEAK